MRLTRKCTRGVTLLEILIASATLTIFLTGVYQVYRGVTKSFQQTNWSLTMQTHARNGLTFIREEMQRASYKTTISIGSVAVDENKVMKIKDGTTSSAQTLAEWYIGIPFRSDIANSGVVFKSSIAISNGRLVYNKTVDQGNNPGEPLYSNKTIMENVTSVTLSVNAFDIDSPTGSQLVSLAVELHHPDTARFPHTKVVERTAAKVDVKVQNL